MLPDVLDLRKVTRKTQERDVSLAPESGQEPAPAEHAPIPDHDEVLLAWETHEFEKRHKDIGVWTFATFGGAALVSVVFLFSHNPVGAAVTVLAACVWLLYAFKEPKVVRFQITPRAFLIGAKAHPWESIESFWIFFEPPEVKEISFRLHGIFSMPLVVPLGTQEPVLVRRLLLLFVPEVEEQPSAIDLLMRRMGF